MRARQQVLGSGIQPTSKNAKKLAQDLTNLQAHIFHQTSSVHFLDQNAEEGHTNYELNKFGLALAREIKNDIRNKPSKKIVEFYVSLLDECWKQKNYELGARVYQGINDAITMDEIKVQPGVFEFPQEDKIVKKVRVKIKANLMKIKLWRKLKDESFPSAGDSKKLYQQHLQDNIQFTPSIQAVMSFNTIRFENSKNILKDKTILPESKNNLLQKIKKVISDELMFIETIVHGVPTSKNLHFPELTHRFENQLTVNLPPDIRSSDEALDDILQLRNLNNKPQNASLKGQVDPHVVRSQLPPQRQKRVHLKPEYQRPDPKKPEASSPHSSKGLVAPQARLFQPSAQKQKRVHLKPEYQRKNQNEPEITTTQPPKVHKK